MKTRMKKIVALMLTVVMTASLAMTGCGKGDGKSKGKTKFTFITAMSDADRTEVIDYVVGRLEEKYPDVEFVNESGDDYNNRAKLAFSSGEGYDLVYTDDLGLTALREAGYLLELSEYAKERGWEEKQKEGITNFYNQRTPGEVYTIGTNYAPVVVYYNKDIFEELNLEIPKTLAEYENVLKTATEAGYIGAENCKDNQNGWYIQSMVQNKAPFEDILDWYYLEESKGTIGTAFKESAELVKKWSDAGYFRKDYEGIDYGDVPSLFGQGQTAMSLDGNWTLPSYEDTGLNVGIFAFPGVEDASQQNCIINPVDAAFAVGKHVDDVELEVALDFIDLMLTEEVGTMWMERGALSAVNSDFSDADITPLTKELLDAVDDTKSGFYLDNAKPGMLDVVLKETQLCIFGEESAEDMWSNIDKFWNEE